MPSPLPSRKVNRLESEGPVLSARSPLHAAKGFDWPAVDVPQRSTVARPLGRRSVNPDYGDPAYGRQHPNAAVACRYPGEHDWTRRDPGMEHLTPSRDAWPAPVDQRRRRRRASSRNSAESTGIPGSSVAASSTGPTKERRHRLGRARTRSMRRMIRHRLGLESCMAP